MSRGVRYTEEEYQALIAKLEAHSGPIKMPDRAAVPVADAKPTPKNESSRTNQGNKIHSRVRIHYHSKRRRLIDPDRLYSHPATDGLRKGGLLVDDSLKYVEAVTNSQEKAKWEETVIELWEIGRPP